MQLSKKEIISQAIAHFRADAVDIIRQKMHEEIDDIFVPASIEKITDKIETYLEDLSLGMYEQVQAELQEHYEARIEQLEHQLLDKKPKKVAEEFIDMSTMPNRNVSYKKRPSIKIESAPELHEAFGQPSVIDNFNNPQFFNFMKRMTEKNGPLPDLLA